MEDKFIALYWQLFDATTWMSLLIRSQEFSQRVIAFNHSVQHIDRAIELLEEVAATMPTDEEVASGTEPARQG